MPRNSARTPSTHGDARRRFFYGPGIDNAHMALLKNIGLTESKSLQLRFEAFNVFNHPQFFGPHPLTAISVVPPSAKSSVPIHLASSNWA